MKKIFAFKRAGSIGVHCGDGLYLFLFSILVMSAVISKMGLSVFTHLEFFGSFFLILLSMYMIKKRVRSLCSVMCGKDIEVVEDNFLARKSFDYFIPVEEIVSIKGFESKYHIRRQRFPLTKYMIIELKRGDESFAKSRLPFRWYLITLIYKIFSDKKPSYVIIMNNYLFSCEIKSFAQRLNGRVQSEKKFSKWLERNIDDQ